MSSEVRSSSPQQEQTSWLSAAKAVVKDTWDEFATKIGSDPTNGISGGLFILKSQSEANPASGLSRMGHAFLGVAKGLAVIGMVHALPAAHVLSFVLGGGLAGLSLLARSGTGVVMGLGIMAAGPEIAIGLLLKSAYHDFKLAAKGVA